MTDKRFPEPETETTEKRTNPALMIIGGILAIVVTMALLHLTGVVG